MHGIILHAAAFNADTTKKLTIIGKYLYGNLTIKIKQK
jgi:hypothetical protein